MRACHTYLEEGGVVGDHGLDDLLVGREVREDRFRAAGAQQRRAKYNRQIRRTHLIVCAMAERISFKYECRVCCVCRVCRVRVPASWSTTS